MSGEIVLSDKKPLAAGRQRVVYLHPDNNSAVLKLSKPDMVLAVRQHKPFRFLLRPAGHYDFVLREYKSYLAAAAHNCPLILRHLPRYYGIVQTDIGTAIMAQLIRGADGKPALGLDGELEREGRMTAALRSALDEFLECARRPWWSSCDFQPNNLLVSDNGNGRKQIYHCEYVHKRMGVYAFAAYRRRKKEKGIEGLTPLLNRYP